MSEGISPGAGVRTRALLDCIDSTIGRTTSSLVAQRTNDAVGVRRHPHFSLTPGFGRGCRPSLPDAVRQEA